MRCLGSYGFSLAQSMSWEWLEMPDSCTVMAFFVSVSPRSLLVMKGFQGGTSVAVAFISVQLK